MYKIITNNQLVLVGNIDEVLRKLKYYSLKFDTLGDLFLYLNN